MAATLRQIAEHLGLSQPTVSHVLNNRGQFRPETRQRVLAAAQKLGYVPNAAARAMRNNRTFQVGVVIANDRAHPGHAPQNFFAITGLNEGLQSRGYVFSVVRVSDVLAEDPQQQSRVFRERMLDGIVVLNANRRIVEKRVGSLVGKTVWADASHWATHNCIRPDEYAAGRLASEALVRGGARRLVWLDPDIGIRDGGLHYSFSERRRGAEDAAAEAGVSLVGITCSRRANKLFDQSIAEYLTPGTGIVAYDALRARTVALSAMRKRLCPGENFGLACCEIVPEQEWNWPELTRAGFDRFAFGEAVAEMVVSLLDESGAPQLSTRYPCQFVQGSTCRCG
jgi:DNA-binding LacI/PurR family transcriptional regulator